MSKRVVLPSISFIVARSYPGNVIGCENRLPWKLRSDLKRFRALTTGHAVIMGRKTFESIGRVLPDRTNVILSRFGDRANDKNLFVGGDENLIWASGLEAALFAADIFSIIRGRDDFFIIGGEEIFEIFDRFVNRVYLTLVFGEIAGDAKFEKQFPSKVWRTKEEVDIPASDYDEYPSRFIVYERRERRYRQRYLSSFYTEQPAKAEWMENILAENASKIEDYAEHHIEEQKELFELEPEKNAPESRPAGRDWTRLNALTDEDIERMAEADTDNPITEEKDWSDAGAGVPSAATSVDRSQSIISGAHELSIQTGTGRDPENPELTDEQLASLRPAKDVLPPALYDALVKRGRGRT